MCRLLLLANIIYETTEVWKEFCTVNLLLCGSLWADSSLTNTSAISTYCLLHLHLMATLQSSDYERTVENIFTQFVYMNQTLPKPNSSKRVRIVTVMVDTNAGGALMCWLSWGSNVILTVAWQIQEQFMVYMWAVQWNKVYLDENKTVPGFVF